MDNYKRNIAKQYWDLSDKIESLEKTLSNPQFEKNVGEEMAELTRKLKLISNHKLVISLA